MSLDEAIKHCEEVAYQKDLESGFDTDNEHRQIAEWLKDYKRLKEQKPCEDAISRQSVINAIANTCFWLSADKWEELTECINSISTVTLQNRK